ncbi:hypothetical protein DPMN_073139 [Dreissena polymorpha]|uniref:Uncharacterized protein n=1 Tax=Dreissena polymorpha TaxID=45954 RepID=A0A9D4BYH7_DREPO|nr:hypothetical protein DPMN_073139 [Dreissena polymorpha]
MTCIISILARQRPTRIPTPHGPCIVEIDRIVIREVQYQLEVNRCRNEVIIVKGNFGWVWPMWAGCPRIDRIVIREVQYQLEVNRCRNEEIIVKGNFAWVWSMWAGRPRIDRIVLRDVQYQLEVNRCIFKKCGDNDVHNLHIAIYLCFKFHAKTGRTF